MSTTWFSLLQTCPQLASLDDVLSSEIPETQIRLLFLTEFGGRHRGSLSFTFLIIERETVNCKETTVRFLFWLKQLSLSNVPYHLAVTRGAGWKASSAV